MALTTQPGGLTVELSGLTVPTTASTRVGQPGPERSRRRSRRFSVLSYLVTVFVLLSVNFALPRALPGSPLDALTTEGGPGYVQDDATRAALASYYGLDRPLAAQYLGYLGGLAHGDLGVSIRYHVPVGELVAERLPWTALLIGSALALAVGVGWVAGISSAWRRGRGADRGLVGAFVLLHSFPSFFVASVAVLVFSVKLGWLPLSGSITPFSHFSTPWAWVADVGRHLVLPAAVLALDFVTSQYLTMRAAMVSELGADYLLLGRVKGMPDRRLKYRYAARNALLPAVTLTALHLGFAVTASILVESVFAYRGVGRLVFEAVAFRDYPTLAGCFLVLSLAVVTLNAAADALCARLDPRIST